MARTFFDDNGKPQQFPVGKESAKKHRSSKYINTTPCPKCGGTVFFTANDSCLICARHDAADFFGYCKGVMGFMKLPNGICTAHVYTGSHAVGDRDVTPEYRAEIERLRALFPGSVPTGPDVAAEQGLNIWVTSRPCMKAGHFGIRTVNGDCYFCQLEKLTPSPRQAALAAGEKWFTPTDPCPKCGTTSRRRVTDSHCTGCNTATKEPSPRQAAIAAGERTYIPNAPCRKCGTKAPRSVQNGACQGCKQAEPTKGDQRQTPDSLMMAADPNMVVSRKKAKELGLKVYRTGEPCTKGHKGFRYVKSGNCIKCLRGEE